MAADNLFASLLPFSYEVQEPFQRTETVQVPFTRTITETVTVTDHRLVAQDTIGPTIFLSWGPFTADEGYWVEIDLTSQGGVVRVKIKAVASNRVVYEVSKEAFRDRVTLLFDDAYTVEIFNDAQVATKTVSGIMFVKHDDLRTTEVTDYRTETRTVTDFRTVTKTTNVSLFDLLLRRVPA